jgi:hypothetical protein
VIPSSALLRLVASSGPSITIISPVGGEVWYVGTRHYVRWSAVELDEATVMYRDDAGYTHPIVPSVALGDVEWGCCPWTVVDAPTTQCVVVISGYFGEAPTECGAFEIRAVTDADGDGMDDGWEADHLGGAGGLPSEDLDGDGLSNYDEFMNGTDPGSLDTDGDGMDDAWEVANGLDPATDDSSDDRDGDGYTNVEESQAGSDPLSGESTPETVADEQMFACVPSSSAGGVPAAVLLALCVFCGLRRRVTFTLSQL